MFDAADRSLQQWARLWWYRPGAVVEVADGRPKGETGMTDERKYSVEIIRRYREMEKTDAFDRDIVAREPFDLHNGEVTFSCGHRTRILARMIDRMPDKFQCHACADEWLAEAVRQEKPEQGH